MSAQAFDARPTFLLLLIACLCVHRSGSFPYRVLCAAWALTLTGCGLPHRWCWDTYVLPESIIRALYVWVGLFVRESANTIRWRHFSDSGCFNGPICCLLDYTHRWHAQPSRRLWVTSKQMCALYLIFDLLCYRWLASGRAGGNLSTKGWRLARSW